MASGENSYQGGDSGIGVPYQESGAPVSTFRGREETLTALSPTPLSVFTGSSEKEYTPAAQKEKTCTVVPPTEVGGGSRFDFAVSTTTTDTEALSKICDRLAQLETNHDQMQEEIHQLKSNVHSKDEEIQKKDKEISQLKNELDETASRCALLEKKIGEQASRNTQLEKKIVEERETQQQQLKQQHQKHKQEEERLRSKITVLKRQKSQIEEERSMLIRKFTSDKQVKEKLNTIETKIDSLPFCEASHGDTYMYTDDRAEPESKEITFTFSKNPGH